MKGRGAVVLLVVAVLLTALLTTSRRTSGPPLDPRSTDPDGAKALVELLASQGASVELVAGVPPEPGGRALLLSDRLTRDDADRLEDWVVRGGVLVVADPVSDLSASTDGRLDGLVLRGRCAADLLVGIERLSLPAVRAYDAAEGRICFATPGEGAAVVVMPVGSGTIVSVAGPALWTNDRLDEEDNAALAAALLGEGTVWFLEPPASGVGAGDDTLTDLIEDPVRALGFQLVIAFLVFAAWRGRRLGRPVAEPLPVEVEASELTAAVSRLLASNRRPDRAAALLRDRARRDLSPVLGLPLDADVDTVVETLARRTGRSDGPIRDAVAGPVPDDETLLAHARTLAAIREELLHERPHTTV